MLFSDKRKAEHRDSNRNQTLSKWLESFEAPDVEPVFTEKRQAINY
jgi:hypothetical protein